LSQQEIQKRTEAYGTITRSQSELDLRAAAATPPPGENRRKQSLFSVREEGDDDDDEAPPPAGNKKQADSSGGGKKSGFSARKMSLADMGLATLKYPTQFDDVDDDDEADGDAPGAFKRPKSALNLAKSDLKSKDWQSEIEGKTSKAKKGAKISTFYPFLMVNSRSGYVHAMQSCCFETKLPNLMLITQPKQLVGSLPLDIAFPRLLK
jgi:hypothetical protein